MSQSILDKGVSIKFHVLTNQRWLRILSEFQWGTSRIATPEKYSGLPEPGKELKLARIFKTESQQYSSLRELIAEVNVTAVIERVSAKDHFGRLHADP